jgi:hypothetical protein
MAADNVTPIPRDAQKAKEGRASDAFKSFETADEALRRARAIVDLLQSAAAFGAIEPPSNEAALADALDVVYNLLGTAAEGFNKARRAQR